MENKIWWWIDTNLHTSSVEMVLKTLASHLLNLNLNFHMYIFKITRMCCCNHWIWENILKTEKNFYGKQVYYLFCMKQIICILLLCYLLKWQIKCIDEMYFTHKVKSLSCVWLFVTPWTVAYQAPLSMGFSRQDYWSGLPFPSRAQIAFSDPPVLENFIVNKITVF